MPGQNSGSLAVAGAGGRRRADREGGARLERGLDGGGDELRGLRVDGDVPAETDPGGPPARRAGPRPAVRQPSQSSLS